ncbi:MAG TPA: lytic transglycosylase domain-containing protein [Terriglobales bacterium]|nr:lytic transglycosylase domain-containing protein [Terriglobales bacterium]
MSAIAIAAFFSQTRVAEAGSAASITPTTDESGRRIYVNDAVTPASPSSAGKSQGTVPGQIFRSQQNRLVYWSSKERRWKSVPHANVQAAQSAAAEVNTYLGKSPSVQNSSARSGFTQREIEAAIEKAATRHNVDANLVRALVKVESNFNPNAVSRKGAMGLMQLMPQTARQLNLQNPFDPQENVDAGVRHLKQLLDNYNGDIRLSLAAYNAGSGAVARSRGVPRYSETQNYVRRITNLYGGNLGSNYFFSISRDPVKVQRDERGVLYISNTD